MEDPHKKTLRFKRYRNRMLALGFPQGLSNIKTLEKQRRYQRQYHQKNKKARRINCRRHDRNRDYFFLGSTRLSRYLFTVAQQQKCLLQRKERAKNVAEEVLQLQKLYPNNHNRQYHKILGYSIGPHNSKLQRRDDMSELPKQQKNPRRRKTISKHA